MLSYREENRLAIRRSGASVFPDPLTRVVQAQRLSGCCCYRREVFAQLEFDTNLKRYGFMEDLDFSYRLYKKDPHALYAIPEAKIIHKMSPEGRLTTKLNIYMRTVYRFYVFFKDIFEGSVRNLVAFILALMGDLLNSVSMLWSLTIRRKPKRDWWAFIYLLGSYAAAFRNLKSILMRRLEFFNKNLER
jgi:GT2 family glycosyltransferase